MTRDGFIELRLKHTGAFTKAAMPVDVLREMIANEVDFYIDAGMLNLDEPKNPQIAVAVRALEAFKKMRISEESALSILERLNFAGLRIVEIEKDKA